MGYFPSNTIFGEFPVRNSTTAYDHHTLVLPMRIWPFLRDLIILHPRSSLSMIISDTSLPTLPLRIEDYSKSRLDRQNIRE